MAQDCTPDGITRLNPAKCLFLDPISPAGMVRALPCRPFAFGAKYGAGVGRAGQTYAIPTKDWPDQDLIDLGHCRPISRGESS